MTQTILKQRIGKIEVHVFTEESSRFNYSVKADKDTPKGKYLKIKNIFYYGYNDLESAIAKADSYINQVAKRDASREQEKQERKEANASAKASDFYKLGDVIVNSWGYDQTNIEFYQVVKVMNKTIEIREISQMSEPDSMMSHGMADKRLPETNSFLSSDKIIKLRVKARGVLSNPENFYYFHKWNGQAKYCSWYG